MEINGVINGYMDDEVIDESEAKLDPDYELYDEISDMEIDDVINWRMDDEIVKRKYFMESLSKMLKFAATHLPQNDNENEVSAF